MTSNPRLNISDEPNKDGIRRADSSFRDCLLPPTFHPLFDDGDDEENESNQKEKGTDDVQWFDKEEDFDMLEAIHQSLLEAEAVAHQQEEERLEHARSKFGLVHSRLTFLSRQAQEHEQRILAELVRRIEWEWTPQKDQVTSNVTPERVPWEACEAWIQKQSKIFSVLLDLCQRRSQSTGNII